MKNLIKLRKNKNLTQKQVALAVGIKETTYRNNELGYSEMSIRNLLKISEFFDTSIDYLVENTLSINMQRINNIDDAIKFFQNHNFISIIENKTEEEIILFAKTLLLLINHFQK